MEKINHVGIAVKDMEEALKFYTETLGLKLLGTEEVPEQKAKVAFLKIGESKVELLETTDPDGPIGKYVEKNGPGIHHLAYQTDDINRDLASLKEQGVRLIDEEPRTGGGGNLIAFIHPKSSYGVLTELCQPK